MKINDSIFQDFTGKTKVSFLIGHPIKQVLAPGLLSKKMRSIGYDGILVPLDIHPDDFDNSLKVIKKFVNIDSILVTLPYKNKCVDHCTSLSDRAKLLGSVNAIKRKGNGEWHGDNFDGEGMLSAIRAKVKISGGESVHIIGAGSAATSIAYSMLLSGVSGLSVFDINKETEEVLNSKLKSHFGDKVRSYNRNEINNADIVINASHCGLSRTDPMPYPINLIRRNQVVADVITDPVLTPFLTSASSAGAIIVTGKDMLLGQLDLLSDFICKK